METASSGAGHQTVTVDLLSCTEEGKGPLFSEVPCRSLAVHRLNMRIRRPSIPDAVDDIHPHRQLFGGLSAVLLRHLRMQSPGNIHPIRMGCQAVGRDHDAGCGQHRQESNYQYALHSHDSLLINWNVLPVPHSFERKTWSIANAEVFFVTLRASQKAAS